MPSLTRASMRQDMLIVGIGIPLAIIIGLLL